MNAEDLDTGNGRPIQNPDGFLMAIKLAEMGLNGSEIARQIGVPRNTVYSWFKSPKFKAQQPLKSDAKFFEVQAIIAEAVKIQQIQQQKEHLALLKAHQQEREQILKACEFVSLFLSNIDHLTERDFEQLSEVVNK